MENGDGWPLGGRQIGWLKAFGHNLGKMLSSLFFVAAENKGRRRTEAKKATKTKLETCSTMLVPWRHSYGSKWFFLVDE